MTAPIPRRDPIRRWFAGLVENCFHVEVGLCDPDVLDYLSALLTEFIHVERIFQAPDGSGRRIDGVIDALTQAAFEAATAADLERRRALYRHVGDFTLFWSGVYPENIRRLRRRGPDALVDYCEQGKRCYAIASDLSSEATRPPAALLMRLSNRFEECVYGLGLVRRNWEDAAADPTGPIHTP